MPSTLVRAARDVTRLVLPVECPGCGCLDVRLCDTCANAWTGDARRCEEGAPRLDRMDGRQVLPVWGMTPYRGSARHVLVAWKDRGRADLARELGGGLEAAALRLAPALAPALAATRHRPTLGVVPAPSSRAARRERGREPVRELAAAVARGLRSGGLDARVTAALRQRGRSHDQVGLGARARAENLRGRLVATRSAVALAGSPVVLVDDVLTTGATLAACEEELARAGVLVVGAVVLAATPAPSAGHG